VIRVALGLSPASSLSLVAPGGTYPERLVGDRYVRKGHNHQVFPGFEKPFETRLRTLAVRHIRLAGYKSTGVASNFLQ
jgi:hypothetical protein